MKKHAKTSVLKRILAVVIAVAVAVSILTVPDAEVSAATGKVKSGSYKPAGKTTDTQKRKDIYLKIKGNSNRKGFKEGYI